MAAGATYEPIATTTLSSATSTVTFSSIPGTYTDLVLIVNTLGLSSANEYNVRINNDSGANYNRTYLTGTGSAANGGTNSGIDTAIIGSYGSSQDFSIAHFMNYANTTSNKTVIAYGGGPSNETKYQFTTWFSTAAITSLVVRAGSGINFNIGTSMTLYGIAAA